MLDQDLKNLWQNTPPQERIRLNQSLLLQEISQEAKEIDQKIRVRDRAEIGVALVMMPFFALVAWFMPFPLTKLGAALVIPWCAFVIFQLKRARRRSVHNFAAPIQTYLQQYRGYLQHQVQLLKGVLYWYLLPFTVCMVLFYAGFYSNTSHLAFHLVLVFVLNLLVYLANRYAVKKDLQPLLHKIDHTISALEKE